MSPARTLILILAAVSTAAAAKPAAEKKPHAGPRAIGRFDDWVAATNAESGQPVCYAFTRVSASSPAVPGRGDVVLTVTQRPGGRDAVAISAGFAYGQNAAVQVVADAATMAFYTAGRSAFARDGHAAVAAFQKAARVTARSPGPRAAVISDSFSLRGFSAAYAAITRACPARG